MRRFYGPKAHHLTICLFCFEECDPAFPDHAGGNCVDFTPLSDVSRYGLIYLFAREHEFVSANLLRAAYPDEWAAIPETQRGPALGRMAQRGYLERVGLEASTSGKTNRAELNRYRSRIYQPGLVAA